MRFDCSQFTMMIACVSLSQIRKRLWDWSRAIFVRAIGKMMISSTLYLCLVPEFFSLLYRLNMCVVERLQRGTRVCWRRRQLALNSHAEPGVVMVKWSGVNRSNDIKYCKYSYLIYWISTLKDPPPLFFVYGNCTQNHTVKKYNSYGVNFWQKSSEIDPVGIVLFYSMILWYVD